MPSEIKPGQWINVKVKAHPRTAAAVKTLVRLFEKDRRIKAERKRTARSRIARSHIRGGRPWFVRPPRLRLVKTEPGACYRIYASLDVLRDLASIERYVEITPA